MVIRLLAISDVICKFDHVHDGRCPIRSSVARRVASGVNAA